MVPWLVRTTLSMTLYTIVVYMKLFNMASPKFGERGGAIMQSIEVAQVSPVTVGSLIRKGW
jgi:hypothetical protein